MLTLSELKALIEGRIAESLDYHYQPSVKDGKEVVALYINGKLVAEVLRQGYYYYRLWQHSLDLSDIEEKLGDALEFPETPVTKKAGTSPPQSQVSQVNNYVQQAPPQQRVCFKCGTPLQQFTNKQTGQKFWGCPNYTQHR